MREEDLSYCKKLAIDSKAPETLCLNISKSYDEETDNWDKAMEEAWVIDRNRASKSDLILGYVHVRDKDSKVINRKVVAVATANDTWD